MDAESNIVMLSPWEIEEITEECFVYRSIHHAQRKKGRRFPKPDAFGLRAGEEYRSFNWERYIDVSKNFDVIGITHNKITGEPLNIKDFTIFRFPVAYIKSQSSVTSVEHIPVWDEENYPSLIGSPNNKSHAGVFCQVMDLEFRDNMSEYCEDLKNLIEFDRDAYQNDIAVLRERGNETPYHKEWVFI